jgi:DHA1 family bicyclomycin/chloramphenicol resistance-like MFS transporter
MPKSSHVPEIEFIAIIATLMALVALAINMILPAFAVMTTDFELSTSTQIGLVVSLLYVGLAVGQITFGALSDSIGRKPAMNAGLMIFVAGAALSWGGQHSKSSLQVRSSKAYPSS